MRPGKAPAHPDAGSARFRSPASARHATATRPGAGPATVLVPGLKNAVPLATDALSRNLAIDDGSLTELVKIKDKNDRKTLNSIAKPSAAHEAG